MLTKEEVQHGYFDFYGRKLTDQEVDKMFQNINHAGTGVISYSEFVVAAMFEKNLIDNSRLEAAFAMFDSDGDGVISVDNFKQVLSFFKDETESDENVDEYILNKIIKQVDSDGDGQISYLDFQKMMIATVAEENPPDLTAPPPPIPPPTTTTPMKGHVRQRSAIMDVANAESYMSLFAEAALLDSEEASKRHRRNLSHLSHFANPDSLPEDAVMPVPTHKKATFSMSMLPEEMSEHDFSDAMLPDMSEHSNT